MIVQSILKLYYFYAKYNAGRQHQRVRWYVPRSTHAVFFFSFAASCVGCSALCVCIIFILYFSIFIFITRAAYFYYVRKICETNGNIIIIVIIFFIYPSLLPCGFFVCLFLGSVASNGLSIWSGKLVEEGKTREYAFTVSEIWLLHGSPKWDGGRNISWGISAE